jgi:hypothetical protein
LRKAGGKVSHGGLQKRRQKTAEEGLDGINGITELRQEEHEGHEGKAGRFFDGINKIYSIMREGRKCFAQVEAEGKL